MTGASESVSTSGAIAARLCDQDARAPGRGHHRAGRDEVDFRIIGPIFLALVLTVTLHLIRTRLEKKGRSPSGRRRSSC